MGPCSQTMIMKNILLFIKDFELEITRTTKANTKTAPFDNPEADGFDVHVFADIRKQLLVQGNKYQVVYA